MLREIYHGTVNSLNYYLDTGAKYLGKEKTGTYYLDTGAKYLGKEKTSIAQVKGILLKSPLCITG